MKKIIIEIIKSLTYLTPIGFFLNLILYYTQGKEIPGITIRRDGLVLVKENPTIYDRITWLVSGLFILFEWYYFLRFFDDLLGGIVWGGLIFGLPMFIAFISCLYPRFYWNKKFSLRSGIIILIIIALIFFLSAYYIVSFL